jgi:uncharacterized protein YkwD
LIYNAEQQAAAPEANIPKGEPPPSETDKALDQSIDLAAQDKDPGSPEKKLVSETVASTSDKMGTLEKQKEKDAQTVNTAREREANVVPQQELYMRQLTACTETTGRLDSIIRREKSSISDHENDRKSTGKFGSFNRWWTGSDPYKIQIQNSKQVIGTVEMAKKFVVQAQGERDPAKKVDLLNKARRLAGMREVTANFTSSEQAPVSAGVNRVNTNIDHYVAEQQAITASQDTIETVMDIGGMIVTLGASGVVKAAVKKGTTEAVKLAAKKAVIKVAGELAANVGENVSVDIMKDIARAKAEGKEEVNVAETAQKTMDNMARDKSIQGGVEGGVNIAKKVIKKLV